MLKNSMKELIQLSLPILLTRLLGMSSHFLMMIMIAHQGKMALSASALLMGISSITTLLILSFNFSICALIAEAIGKKNNEEVANIIFSSLILNTLLSLLCFIFFYYIPDFLLWMHQEKMMIDLTSSYFRGMMFGFIPMMWTNVLEQFLIGLNKPKYIMYLSLLNLLLAPLLTMIFMNGYFGMVPLGMLGAGYGISVVSFINLLYFICIIFRKQWHRKYHLLCGHVILKFSHIKKLFYLGWPIALQYIGELSAYFFMTIMMGWVSVDALAAQQIILQLMSIIIMIPMSISQAVSVRVAYAKGIQEQDQIYSQVDASLILVILLMGLVAGLYFLMPQLLIKIYLDVTEMNNHPLISLTMTLLYLTALGQGIDAIKQVLVGAYRGIQETKIPMLINTGAVWLISVPSAYFIAFNLKSGAIGIRLGFILGTIVGTSFLAMFWYKKKSIFSIPNLNESGLI